MQCMYLYYNPLLGVFEIVNSLQQINYKIGDTIRFGKKYYRISNIKFIHDHDGERFIFVLYCDSCIMEMDETILNEIEAFNN